MSGVQKNLLVIALAMSRLPQSSTGSTRSANWSPNTSQLIIAECYKKTEMENVAFTVKVVAFEMKDLAFTLKVNLFYFWFE